MLRKFLTWKKGFRSIGISYAAHLLRLEPNRKALGILGNKVTGRSDMKRPRRWVDSVL